METIEVTNPESESLTEFDIAGAIITGILLIGLLWWGMMLITGHTKGKEGSGSKWLDSIYGTPGTIIQIPPSTILDVPPGTYLTTEYCPSVRYTINNPDDIPPFWNGWQPFEVCAHIHLPILAGGSWAADEHVLKLMNEHLVFFIEPDGQHAERWRFADNSGYTPETVKVTIPGIPVDQNTSRGYRFKILEVRVESISYP